MWSRILACRSGAVSVEAAILYPVLIALALGSVEFGMLIFTFSSMQSAAREVTREVAVNHTSAAGATAAVLERLPAWSQDVAEVAVSQTTPGTPETNVVEVEVRMPAEGATPVRIFLRATDGWMLRTAVAMKQELPL